MPHQGKGWSSRISGNTTNESSLQTCNRDRRERLTHPRHRGGWEFADRTILDLRAEMFIDLLQRRMTK
jgi:hypothetical protein